MTTVTINIPDQQATALTAQATAHGLSLEEWIKKLATDAAPLKTSRYTAAELVNQCDPDAPLSSDEQVWMDASPVGREVL